MFNDGKLSGIAQAHEVQGLQPRFSGDLDEQQRSRQAANERERRADLVSGPEWRQHNLCFSEVGSRWFDLSASISRVRVTDSTTWQKFPIQDLVPLIQEAAGWKMM